MAAFFISSLSVVMIPTIFYFLGWVSLYFHKMGVLLMSSINVLMSLCHIGSYYVIYSNTSEVFNRSCD